MKEELNMDDIRRMDDANLKSIGIEMFKHRRDIMEAASVYETRKNSSMPMPSTKHMSDTSSSSRPAISKSTSTKKRKVNLIAQNTQQKQLDHHKLEDEAHRRKSCWK